MEQLGERAGVAEAQVLLAQLAVFGGQLGEATAYLSKAASNITPVIYPVKASPLLSLVQGQLLLTQGDFVQAEEGFGAAYKQAEGQQEPQLAAEALAGMARVKLSQGELDAASTMFTEARRRFQLLESTDGEGAAVLGIAQVLIGQERWDEAVQRCEEALTRFNQSDNLIGQADTMLSLGLAHRGDGTLEEAATDFEQALKLYRQQQQPLGEADTRYERAGIFLVQGNLAEAREEFSRAIALVEQVMRTMSIPQQWRTFLRQYAELYAQQAITLVRLQQDAQALTQAQSFADIAGRDAIAQQIKAYEETVPTSGEELTEDEIRENKELVKRLGQLRKRLR